MDSSLSLLHTELYKFPWNDKENTLNTMVIPPTIYLLYNMDIVITKKGEMSKHMVDISKLELDKLNIGGGYNTVNIMDFCKAQSYWAVIWISRLEG